MNLFTQFLFIVPLVFGLTGAQTTAPLHVSINADGFEIPALFDAAWTTKQGSRIVCKAFRAGVVNHHALASDLLAGFFATLKRCEPDITHFIILSPDHFSQAHASVATHGIPYRTNGVEIPSVAATLTVAVDQPELFAIEHGIGALIPFLAHEFPKARVTPVVIKASISDADREKVSVWLHDELKNPHTFVIVSSDMSHYLSESQAILNDQITKTALGNSDATFFAKADDGFTDNGPSVAATQTALEKTKWTLMKESISSAYGGSPGFTTSYLVGFWE